MATGEIVIQAREAGPGGPACMLVIFGASGNLAKRKLISAILQKAIYCLENSPLLEWPARR